MNSSSILPSRPSVVRGSLLLISIGVGVKALALVKEIAVAASFGLSGDVDALFVVLSFQSFALNVLGASYAAAIVPEVVALRVKDGTESTIFIQRAIGLTLLSAAVITLLFALLGEVIVRVIGYGLDDERRTTATTLYYVILPLTVFGCLNSILTAVASASHRFAIPAFVPAITVVSTVSFLILLDEEWGIVSIAAGITIGCVLESLVLCVYLGRIGVRIWPKWPEINGPVRRLLKQSLSLAVGGALMSAGAVIDQSMASMLVLGDVATLAYGSRLTAVLVTILGSIGVACLPHFSHLHVNDNGAEKIRSLFFLAFFVLLLSLPVVLTVYLTSDWLIQLLFERGAFTTADSADAAFVQRMCVFQTPFYLLLIVGVRMLTASRHSLLVVGAALLFLVIKCIGNLILMQVLGVAGIALASSCAYAVSAACIFFRPLVGIGIGRLRKIRA